MVILGHALLDEIERAEKDGQDIVAWPSRQVRSETGTAWCRISGEGAQGRSLRCLAGISARYKRGYVAPLAALRFDQRVLRVGNSLTEPVQSRIVPAGVSGRVRRRKKGDRMAKQVTVYSQPGWGACDREKEFLSQNGVPFVVKDIRADQAALQELVKLGFRATPVTLIDGEAVVGFDREKLQKLLGLA
jgi:glutaredoxin 3